MIRQVARAIITFLAVLAIPLATAQSLIHLPSERTTEEVATALAAGADPNELDSEGRTPLMYAIVNNNPEMIHLLVDAGADLEYEHESFGMPLHFASMTSLPDTMLALIAAGANIEATHGGEAFMGSKPIHTAAFGPNIDSPTPIQILAAAGADLNAVTPNGETPLLLALLSGPAQHAQKTADLTTNGANLEYQSGHPGTVLHWAVLLGQPGHIHNLVTAGANINARGPLGNTPLMLAAQTANHANAEALITAGADVHAVDTGGANALYYAMLTHAALQSAGQPADDTTIRLLGAAGANFDELDGTTFYYLGPHDTP